MLIEIQLHEPPQLVIDREAPVLRPWAPLDLGAHIHH
jgi:hypothetical protein